MLPASRELGQHRCRIVAIGTFPISLSPLSGKTEMIVIVGSIVVVGAVLGGFILSGGQIRALVHPTEILTIGGAALGALIIMSPVKVLKDLVKGLLSTLKGSPFSKNAYDELFKVLYEFLRLARQDGLIALEPHLSNPHESSIFHKYPLIGNNHHVSDFICGTFRRPSKEARHPSNSKRCSRSI